jgi:hypothetical protein
VDEMRLTSKKGEKAFGEDKEAIKALSEIKVPEAWVSEAVDGLVCADAELAQTALADAVVQGGDPGKIAEAQDHLDKAANELDKGQLDHAIDRYKDAWKKAQEAIDKKK